MVCLGLEPGAAGWKAQMNPLSYGGTPERKLFIRLTTVINLILTALRSSNNGQIGSLYDYRVFKLGHRGSREVDRFQWQSV